MIQGEYAQSQLTTTHSDDTPMQLQQQSCRTDPTDKNATCITKAKQHSVSKLKTVRCYKSEWAVEHPWLEYDPQILTHLESLSMVVRTAILSKFQFAYDMLLTIFRYTTNLLGCILQQKVILQHYLVLLWMFCCELIWTFHMLSGKLTMVQVQCLVNMPGCKH
jgi:hypothetical protein